MQPKPHQILPFLLLLILTLTTHATPEAKPRLNRRLTRKVYGPFGGGGGYVFSFDCPPSTTITKISGRSGFYVDQIRFTCSNGKVSDAYGGSGAAPFSADVKPGTLINVRSGAYLEAIRINGVQYGGNGGQNMQGGPNPIGSCVLVGAFGRAGFYVDQLNLD
ncbi:hypothetical protein HDU97_005591 [Phlyctochytrium planicorne]|nr:hypothetical protein HDU97_005591 [Phlyctochytrium planicorne]